MSPGRGGILVAHGVSRGDEQEIFYEPCKGGIIFMSPLRGSEIKGMLCSHDLRHGLLICRPYRG